MNSNDLSLVGGANAKSIAPNNDVLKALRNFRNNAGYVVEQGKVGSNWYRQFSNGWIEQGGRISASGGRGTVTFPKAFTDTNYSVLFVPYGGLVKGNPWIGTEAPSATKCTFTFDGYEADAPYMNWIAFGF